jgi:hypothetical protein
MDGLVKMTRGVRCLRPALVMKVALNKGPVDTKYRGFRFGRMNLGRGLQPLKKGGVISLWEKVQRLTG